jgi:hypothetical protein
MPPGLGADALAKVNAVLYLRKKVETSLGMAWSLLDGSGMCTLLLFDLMLALSCLDAASQALISPFPYSCCTTWQISSTSSPSFSEKVSPWKQDTMEMANCHVWILQASRITGFHPLLSYFRLQITKWRFSSKSTSPVSRLRYGIAMTDCVENERNL